MCSTGFHQSEDVDTLVQPVMTKVECNKEGTNVRHVVTSMYMKSPKEIYERFLLQEGRLRTLHQRTQERAWGRQDVMCEFCSQPVSAVHACCGLCAVA